MSGITRKYSRSREEFEVAARAKAVERAETTSFGPIHPMILALVRWLNVRLSADTAITSLTHFIHFLTYCAREGIDPQSISRHEARVYATALVSAGYAPTTSSTRIATLRSLYSDALEDNVVTLNPFIKIKVGNPDPVTPTPAMTLEECGRFAVVCHVAAASDRLVLQRNGAMAYVMMRVGPRRMEVAAATWGAIKPAGDGLAWRIHGKGDRWGTTIIPADGAVMLMAWRTHLETALGRRVRHEEPIFPSLGHFRPGDLPSRAIDGTLAGFGRKAISTIFKAMLKQAGVEGLGYNAHTARATAASQAYAATKDLLAVQKMLRHRYQTTTLKYIRLEGNATPAASWLPPEVPMDGVCDANPEAEAA